MNSPHVPDIIIAFCCDNVFVFRMVVAPLRLTYNSQNNNKRYLRGKNLRKVGLLQFTIPRDCKVLVATDRHDARRQAIQKMCYTIGVSLQEVTVTRCKYGIL